MATDATFSSILNEMEVSNLNVKIELTPFAAIITLKKTPIKNQNGIFAIPATPTYLLLQQAEKQIYNLREVNATLKETVDEYESNAKKSKRVIDEIDYELVKAEKEVSEFMNGNKEMERRWKG